MMLTLILFSLVFLSWNVFDAYLLRKQKIRTESLIRDVRGDIKSLSHNQKVIYSSLKELNNRVTKYEKGQKASHQTKVIRPNEPI